MEHFVTLFDSLFLPQGLALHLSMERHVKDYLLWILCVDDEAHDVLTKLQLPNVRLLRLSQLETPELLSVKSSRNKGEYCWTLTPFAPRFVFEADKTIARVTYLDADMWFRDSPSMIFNEFENSRKDVLVTEHGYAPEFDQSAASGKYCVQFLTFTKTVSEPVREWWEKKCIEWCYAKLDNGRFGDQKYLDDWPERFNTHVHVLSNKELMMAPWNSTRFPYSGAKLWHFHGFRIAKYGRTILFFRAPYSIPRVVSLNVYRPYEQDIISAIINLKNCGHIVLSQNTRPTQFILTALLRQLVARFRILSFLSVKRCN